jgi:hypothetical protein
VTSLQFTQPAPVVGGPNPFLTYRPKLAPDVEQAVDRWLTQQAAGIRIMLLDGRVSMPEVVDRVRRGVPEAAEASPDAIRPRVIEIVGVVPETRSKPDLGGQNVEWAARISNLFPIPPTSVTFGGSNTSLTVGIKGAELKTGKLTTKAGVGGAESELKQGDVKVGVSGKWDGSEFGLKTEVGGAHAAIAESLGHLQAGGSLTDGYVTERMGKVKPSIDAAKNIAGRTKPGATLRVTAGAEGGGWSAGVSLVIVF